MNTQHHNGTRFAVNIQLSHALLRLLPGQQACYVLLDITPTHQNDTARLPLNLCLTIDKSTSMQGIRLQQVKEATRQIIDQLQPDDSFSLIAFSDRAEVIIPAQKNLDPAQAKSLVSTVQPGGGTEMLQGLRSGLQELEKHQSADSVNHLILLTDGQTYGDEEDCLQYARWAGQHQISFSTMGIGTDWNEDLLDAMANASGGVSTYIDSPRKIVGTFKATLRELSTTVAREISLATSPSDNVLLVEAFQISPYIRRLEIENNHANLGPLSALTSKTIVLELRVDQANVPGPLPLANFTVIGDTPQVAIPETRVDVDLKATVSAEETIQVNVPSAIISALGKLAIYKMQEKALTDLANGNIMAATQRMETMATRLLNLGETELARAALLEAGRLSRTGDLSAEGRKKIRYGTRNLSIIPKEVIHD